MKELQQNAKTVLERRYLAKDSNNKPTEDIPGLFRRVAKTIAQADLLYDKDADVAALEETFFDFMTDLKFMPNSPTLMNAGRPLGQLSACFVLPIDDSMDAIFDAVKNAALIHKSGGGTGFSFSRLRPSGATVNSTGGVASGPVSFMKVFNSATEAVKQGGTRRGANMGILRIDHPDILSFIKCKSVDNEISNFNISVGLTEEFMQAVKENRNYDLIDPHTKAVVGQLSAPEVYKTIVEMAHNNGEPGIIFLDRLNRDNVVPTIAEIESTNPCGEQPLLPYESCNLGSLNLNAFIEDGVFDFKALREASKLAVHFLDNVIDVNKYPLPEIDKMTKTTRKIGLGLMGFADVLFKLGIPYNSEEGIAFGRKIMKTINEAGWEASAELAEKRGTFPAFKISTLANGKPVRNATVTTIAPTGTISIICNASSGVEPLFALAYARHVMDNDRLVEVNPYFLEVAKKRGFYSEELMAEIAEKGTLHGIEGIPADVARVFVTAHDIEPEYHIRMQAAFQEYTDNAVSKTVNFTNSATIEDVRTVYDLAYELGCKGVTIYRDGSRSSQVLNIGKSEKKEEAAPVQTAITPRERPQVTQGLTQKIRIGCGNLYVTVNYDENGICEVFTNLGRAGGCPSQSEATSRLVSMALRSGIEPKVIIEQLRGIRCHSTLRRQGINVLSCPDAIGRALEQALNVINGKEAEAIDTKKVRRAAQIQQPVEMIRMTCPECGELLEAEGGCNICRNCGYSHCG
ncbi:MAG: vitamin B12-dependent ribonucleotide reductase [Clostridiales bacterium]|nr:vitamin B12-dependent ribonucleotide reductase [Clostridiales bacterium]